MEKAHRTSAAQLRSLLYDKDMAFLMEAHSGLSAKIIEEAGFKAIWASGLAISTSCAVRDCNELSWTQVVDTLDLMTDAVEIPILVDGDTGYGNFNNFQRFVRKLEQIGIAGVCIEDKLFPKTNSFINGASQLLADREEFCGKLRAAKDVQQDPAFVLVARTEAFIVKDDLNLALERAHAYADAGADAIFVHSKKRTVEDIEKFMAQWRRDVPVIVAPTKYYTTDTSVFESLGIAAVIWANHMIRACTKIMQVTAQHVARQRSVSMLEDSIAPVEELFRLQEDDVLRANELKYATRSKANITGFILAGRHGVELGTLTSEKPKCMLRVGNTSILHRLVEQLDAVGVGEKYVIRGYKKEAVVCPGVEFVDNTDVDHCRGAYYLALAVDKLRAPCLITYGDTLFRKHLLEDVVSSSADVCIVVDGDEVKGLNTGKDFCACSRRCSHEAVGSKVLLRRIWNDAGPEDANGVWTGLLFVNHGGLKPLQAILAEMASNNTIRKASLVHVINRLAQELSVEVKYTRGGWLDVDFVNDYEHSSEFTMLT